MNDTPNLGHLISTTDAQRDAIHIAVAPVIAAGILNPGEHVGFFDEKKGSFCSSSHNIGIVDPFLKQQVKPGQRFWLFLYPGTVTGLRHDWTHPAFAATLTKEEVRQEVINAQKKEMAREWLEHFCLANNPPVHDQYMKYFSPDELLKLATEAVQNGEMYIYCQDNQRMSDGLREQSEEFWLSWSILTDTPLDKVISQTVHYGCSC